MIRWPWKKPTPDREGLASARAALEAAQRDRQRVSEVEARSRRLSARNGFGESIQAAMGGRRAS